MYGWISLLCSHHLYQMPALQKESLSHETVTPTAPLPGLDSNPSVFCPWICLYWIFHIQLVPYIQTFGLRTLWGDLLGCIGGNGPWGQDCHHRWWKEEVPAPGGVGAEGAFESRAVPLLTPVFSAPWILFFLHIHQVLLFILFTAHPEKEISRISPINWVSGLLGRLVFLGAELEFKDHLI